MARFDTVDAWMTGLVLMWGTAFASIAILGQHLDPFQMTWYRYVPFLVLFGGWLLLRRRDRFRVMTGRDWVVVATAGILAVLGYHFPLNWAMSTTTPGAAITAATAAILVATTPLWTLLFAVSSGQEPFDRTRGVGTVVAFGGVLVVVLLGQNNAEVSVVGKAFIALIAPICWSLYNVMVKPLVDRLGGLFITGVTMCLGTLTLLPIGIMYGLEPLANFDAALWWWLAFLSLAATVGGYAIWNLALRHRKATELTAFIFAVPVVATAAAWLLLSQAVTLWFGLGAAMVLFGLWRIHVARTASKTT